MHRPGFICCWPAIGIRHFSNGIAIPSRSPILEIRPPPNFAHTSLRPAELASSGKIANFEKRNFFRSKIEPLAIRQNNIHRFSEHFFLFHNRGIQKPHTNERRLD